MNTTILFIFVLWNIIPLYINIILQLKGYDLINWLNYSAPILAVIWIWVLWRSPSEEEYEAMYLETYHRW